MKRLIVLPLLLVCACASSMSNSETLEAGPGSEIGINVVDANLPALFREDDAAMATVKVEVSNNSDSDVTIRSVEVLPRDVGNTVRLDSGSRTVNHVLAEGKDAQFEISMLAHRSSLIARGDAGAALRVRVLVHLEGDRSYYAEFGLPAPL